MTNDENSKCTGCNLSSDCIKSLECEKFIDKCPGCGHTDNIWFNKTYNARKCGDCFEEW